VISYDWPFALQNRFQLHVLTIAGGDFLQGLLHGAIPTMSPGRATRKSACRQILLPPARTTWRPYRFSVRMRPSADCVRMMTCAVSSRLLLKSRSTDIRCSIPGLCRMRRDVASPASPGDTTGQSPPHPGCRFRHRPGAERAAQSVYAPRQRRCARAGESPARPGSCVAGARVPAAPATAATAARPATRPASGQDRLADIGQRLGQIVDDHHHRRQLLAIAGRIQSQKRQLELLAVVRQREIGMIRDHGEAAESTSSAAASGRFCPCCSTRSPAAQACGRKASSCRQARPQATSGRDAEIGAGHTLERVDHVSQRTAQDHRPGHLAADRIGAAANSVHTSGSASSASLAHSR
jgi:hypothetical protein